MMYEGFQGPPRGVSTIPCGQESSDAVALVGMFNERISTTDEGEADLMELKTILSKMCCMKHDLMGVAQVVQSTLRLPYNTTHDRENVGDTVGRCFTKGIPSRDLDITYTTWKDRGLALLNRLCTSYTFGTGEADQAKQYFMATWTECFTIAKTVCLVPEPNVSDSPRDLKGIMSDAIKNLGLYKGYY